ncbi:glycosyltransferase family 4 protein [Microvirga sp. HBU67558]|uniref:glycosyltransferase family 4 protein n=1 Tax=Microvirga TaxID=186650 RepID=UPI001B398401|nr:MULTISPECIES: glycosyltransferase family 4 protein [unclassified Microvirga]MBQ0820539.1 glycosyltransferase family 4 protein [Microvirga sp. HBU67558]
MIRHFDRIILISPGGRSGGGGIGSVTDGIARWIEINDVDVRVSVLDPRGEGTVLLSPLYLISAFVQAIFLSIISRRVIFHVQVSERTSVIRKGIFVFLGRLLRKRTILHHHGAEFESFYLGANQSLMLWTKSIVTMAHVNIVLGRKAAEFLVDIVGATPSRVCVLPNAVSDLRSHVQSIRQRSVSASHPQSGATNLLLLANLSPRKGVSEFLAALSELHAEGIPVHAVLCGGGEINRYRQEARQLGLDDDVVEFTGWVNRDEVRSILARTDVFVLPSFNEGLPMSILEAVSAEIPVVTTPVGAIPEVFTDGVNCLLVPPGDSQALKSAINKLISNPRLAKALTANARALYQDNFALESYMERLQTIYADGGCPKHPTR